MTDDISGKAHAVTSQETEFEPRDEYDLSSGTRNPYIQRFQELNLVSLDADVKAAFPDSQAVNEALRLLIKTAQNAKNLRKAS